MQRKARLVQQQNCPRVSLQALDEEDKVEAQEPLKAGAPAFKFDVLRALVGGCPILR